MIRIAAINQIDRSPYTEPVVVKTQEEGILNCIVGIFVLLYTSYLYIFYIDVVFYHTYTS